MITTFDEMEREIQGRTKKPLIALAGAEDESVLEAVAIARQRGVADAILIGKKAGIVPVLERLGEKESDYEFIEVADETACAREACALVRDGKADIPMKGLMQTATFMHAVLDRESFGLVPEGGLLSQSTVVEHGGRLLLITDCSVNIAPGFKEKSKIIRNAVGLSRKFGNEVPKVAALAPLETVNPKIPSTVDAAMLAKASDRGQLGSCIVDGPLGFDNAMSEEAARHKGIKSEVAGHPDILLVPDLACGNILTKALVHFAEGINSCGVLLGCRVPVVMSSRTDTPINKYRSILVSVL
jgi:phosphate butyryltransferase